MTTAWDSAATGVGRTARDWWRRYAAPAAARGDVAARLRRCRTTTDAFAIPEALALAIRIGTTEGQQQAESRRLESALGLARVLAHVRTDSDETPMRAAGWRSFPGDRKESEGGADRPRLAEARLKRLLQTERGEEQVTAFARLVHLLDNSVNVRALAEDFLYWNDRTRRRWAYDYYAAGAAAPSEFTTTEDFEE